MSGVTFHNILVCFVGFPGHPHPYAMAAMFAAMTGNGGFFANQMGQAPPPGCMVN